MSLDTRWCLILALALGAPPALECFPDGPPEVDQIKCTMVLPDEIFLDFSLSTIVNNNLGGVAQAAEDRWLSGPGYTLGVPSTYTNMSACPRADCQGNTCTEAFSGCLPNPDQTMTILNVLSNGFTATNNVDSYKRINNNLRLRSPDDGREITSVSMVVSIPPGGRYYANSFIDNGLSTDDSGNAAFLYINTDGYGNKAVTAPDGTDMGCNNNNGCRSNFMLQFIDTTPNAAMGDDGLPFKIEIPAMEFTWYDFDSNWDNHKGSECMYVYEWQKYATTGPFIDQGLYRYHTTNIQHLNYRRFMAYVSPGCGTNMPPNYELNLNGDAVWKYTDSLQTCPTVDDTVGSTTYTYQTGVTTGVTAGSAYCFPGNPMPKRDGVTPIPPTGVYAYWKTQSPNLQDKSNPCLAGTDFPGDAEYDDINTMGYSTLGTEGDEVQVLHDYYGATTPVTLASDFLVEWQLNCPTFKVGDNFNPYAAEVMCANNENHPLFTTMGDTDCSCRNKHPVTGRGDPVSTFKGITTLEVTGNAACGGTPCIGASAGLTNPPTRSQLKVCNTIGGDGEQANPNPHC